MDGFNKRGSVFLQNVILDGKKVNINISDGRFTAIGADISAPENVRIIDGKGELAVIPPFYNSHNHAAMTLFRGYSDDMKVLEWLEKYIWPAEAKMDAHDVYIGTKLAIIEMIRTGTVFFNDMYWFPAETYRAAVEMGMRAQIGIMVICAPGGEVLDRAQVANDQLWQMAADMPSDRVKISAAPHAIYTVPGEALKKLGKMAAEKDMFIHIHASESMTEVENCLKEHGKTPIAYLDELGVLNERCVLAHCTNITGADAELISSRGAVIAHMPVSNMKLASGIFDLEMALAAGCKVTIGTDGCCSNNNLSMFDEMKCAALVAKIKHMQADVGNAGNIYRCATGNCAAAFNINAGKIAVGMDADALLVDLNSHFMVADYEMVSNLVYAADSSIVNTVICDGNVLMENRVIPGEKEIIDEARRLCDKFRC